MISPGEPMILGGTRVVNLFGGSRRMNERSEQECRPFPHTTAQWAVACPEELSNTKQDEPEGGGVFPTQDDSESERNGC